jgi:hypothetical protein
VPGYDIRGVVDAQLGPIAQGATSHTHANREKDTHRSEREKAIRHHRDERLGVATKEPA